MDQLFFLLVALYIIYQKPHLVFLEPILNFYNPSENLFFNKKQRNLLKNHPANIQFQQRHNYNCITNLLIPVLLLGLAIYRLKIELGFVYLMGGRNDLKFDECPRNLAGCCVPLKARKLLDLTLLNLHVWPSWPPIWHVFPCWCQHLLAGCVKLQMKHLWL